MVILGGECSIAQAHLHMLDGSMVVKTMTTIQGSAEVSQPETVCLTGTKFAGRRQERELVRLVACPRGWSKTAQRRTYHGFLEERS